MQTMFQYIQLPWFPELYYFFFSPWGLVVFWIQASLTPDKLFALSSSEKLNLPPNILATSWCPASKWKSHLDSWNCPLHLWPTPQASLGLITSDFDTLIWSLTFSHRGPISSWLCSKTQHDSQHGFPPMERCGTFLDGLLGHSRSNDHQQLTLAAPIPHVLGKNSSLWWWLRYGNRSRVGENPTWASKKQCRERILQSRCGRRKEDGHSCCCNPGHLRCDLARCVVERVWMLAWNSRPYTLVCKIKLAREVMEHAF